jgi:hypothetical protein
VPPALSGAAWPQPTAKTARPSANSQVLAWFFMGSSLSSRRIGEHHFARHNQPLIPVTHAKSLWARMNRFEPVETFLLPAWPQRPLWGPASISMKEVIVCDSSSVCESLEPGSARGLGSEPLPWVGSTGQWPGDSVDHVFGQDFRVKRAESLAGDVSCAPR